MILRFYFTIIILVLVDYSSEGGVKVVVYREPLTGLRGRPSKIFILDFNHRIGGYASGGVGHHHRHDHHHHNHHYHHHHHHHHHDDDNGDIRNGFDDDDDDSSKSYHYSHRHSYRSSSEHRSGF